MTRALCVGECMVELTHADERTLRLGFAGDTYNAAVYLVRTARELGVDVETGYLTGLGDDEYSAALRVGVGAPRGSPTTPITVPGRVPGLYTIRTSPSGERRFTYWRGESAARHLLAGGGWCDRVEGDVVHLSGITLQLTTPASLDALVARLARAARGRRPDQPRHELPARRLAVRRGRRPRRCDRVAAVAGVVLAVARRRGAAPRPVRPEDAVRRLLALGAGEVVLRDGADGAYVADGDDVRHVPGAAGRPRRRHHRGRRRVRRRLSRRGPRRARDRVAAAELAERRRRRGRPAPRRDHAASDLSLLDARRRLTPAPAAQPSTQASPAMIGTSAPCRSTPSTATSGPPIITSWWTTEWFTPSASCSASSGGRSGTVKA